MEDDIRDVVRRTLSSSKPRAPRRTSTSVVSESKKSRSKSTTAKERTKKKTPSNTATKSRAKSTATGKKKNHTKAKSSDAENEPLKVPESITAVEKKGSRKSTPDHLKNIIVSPKPKNPVKKVKPKNIKPVTLQKTVDGSETKEAKKKSANAKNSPKSKPKEKEEEPRKRRERLMTSPFEFLQVKYIQPPADDDASFQDDISHLTLPKPLRELEKKQPQAQSSSLLGPSQPEYEESPDGALAMFLTSEATPQSSEEKISLQLPKATPGWTRKPIPSKIPRESKKSSSSTATGDKDSSGATASTKDNVSSPVLGSDIAIYASHTLHYSDSYRNTTEKQKRNDPSQEKVHHHPHLQRNEEHRRNGIRRKERIPNEIKRKETIDKEESTITNYNATSCNKPGSTMALEIDSVMQPAASLGSSSKRTLATSMLADWEDIESGAGDAALSTVMIRVVGENGKPKEETTAHLALWDRFYLFAGVIMCFLVIVIISAILVIFLVPRHSTGR